MSAKDTWESFETRMGTYLSHTQIPVRVQCWDEVVIGHGEEGAGARKQPRYSLPLILEWTGQGPQDGSQRPVTKQAKDLKMISRTRVVEGKNLLL